MHKQRIAILIAAGVGMLATFLPWVQVPMIGAVNGSAGDGWITLSLYAVSFVLGLLGTRSKPMAPGLRIGCVVPAILSSAMGIWKIVDFKSKMANVGGGEIGQSMADAVTIGMGLYFVVICGIALTIMAFILKENGPMAESNAV